MILLQLLLWQPFIPQGIPSSHKIIMTTKEPADCPYMVVFCLHSSMSLSAHGNNVFSYDNTFCHVHFQLSQVSTFSPIRVVTCSIGQRKMLLSRLSSSLFDLVIITQSENEHTDSHNLCIEN